MARKARGGNSYKTQYKAYKVKGQWRKNKQAKLERRALVNENDSSALETFEKGSKQYGRGRPGNKGWFHPQEMRLLRQLKDAKAEDKKPIEEKLTKLRAVHTDSRPSAIRNAEKTQPQPTIVDQLYEIGVINEKRRNAAKARVGRIRRR